MKDIELLWDERKIILSPVMLDKMKYLVRRETFISKSNLKLLENTEMSMKHFFSVYEEVYRGVRNTVSLHIEHPYGTNLDTNLQEQVLDLSKKIMEFKEDYGYENLSEIIDLMYELKKVEETMYLTRDLKKAQDDYIIDMRYFMAEQAIIDFNNAFEQAKQENNIQKMRELILNVQKLILDEWAKYVQSIDEMTDDNFCMLGHSTSSVKYDKEFYTRFVSCSLYDQDVHDTYRLGYGFVFAPKNIVGANSQDMYVKNTAEDSENLLGYSSIPIIHHPKRILEEMKKKRRKLKK